MTTEPEKWYESEDVKPLLAGLKECIFEAGETANRLHMAMDELERCAGSLPRALWAIAGGIGSSASMATKEHIGVRGLRMLCSFSPPLVGQVLVDTYQAILDGQCIACGQPAMTPASSDRALISAADDPECMGMELFLCRRCSENELITLDEACASLGCVPATALPNLQLPPRAGGKHFTLRMFVLQAGAVERETAAGAPRPRDCFPPRLEAQLLRSDAESREPEQFIEDTKDPLFVTMPEGDDVETRRLLYEMRALGGEIVAAELKHLTTVPEAAKPKPKQPPPSSAASQRVGGPVHDPTAGTRRTKLRRMATRWKVTREAMGEVSPIAAALWKCKDILPGPGIIGNASQCWGKFLTLKTREEVPDTVLPAAIAEAAKQLRVLTAIVSRASLGTDPPRLVCARTIQDKLYNGPTDTKPKHAKPKGEKKKEPDTDSP